jgi:soluble calcium-activated nucleotidase 1
MITANEDFSDVKVTHVGKVTPVRGFSAFKFVPGTNEHVIVALKSAENEEAQTQESYITVFTVDGDVLMQETQFGASKFEGIAFV